MEKLQTLGLILLALVFFVWRMVQKMRATTRQEQQERPIARVPRPNTSFEDMLKQMQQQNQRGNTPTVPTTPAGRALPHEQARPARSLERPAAPAVSLERRVANVSLEKPAPARRATPLEHSSKNTLPRTKPLQTNTSAAPNHPLTERLRNPADLRAAFVLSEILKRKFE